MNKTAIKNFAIWARNKLIADITYKSGLLGITEKEVKSPLPQSTKDVQFFDIGTKEPNSITGIEIEQRRNLADVIGQKTTQSNYKTVYKSVVEEVAYTWFNRLIAVRFMEINAYLPSHIRVLSSESGNKIEPDLITTPFDSDLEFTPYEKDRIVQLKNENKLDELFRMLFIKQCNALNVILPNLFEKTSDYTELLLNVSFADKDGVVFHLVHDIQADDFNISKEGQVEIIGWLYQYYNTEPKDEAFALLKKNVKITKERIPAATQLFTPDWIVRYMVENSLGRLWIEGHPNETLKAEWKYYLDEAEQEADVQKQLKAIREEYKIIKPEDIKIIDPCMGSGHILVYAFDILMSIYESCGYSQRDAAKSIIETNIYGLDIDDRAYQLAYFAVMMKARQYNRRILNGETRCHVYSIQESNGINRNHLKYFGDGLSESENNTALIQMQGLLDTFNDAKEYGTIISFEDYNWELLNKFICKINIIGQISMGTSGIEKTQTRLRLLVEIATVLVRKYDVVATNPPYMGSSSSSGKLNEYIKNNYPDNKADIFAVFIERCGQMTKINRYQAMITQHSWMFLSSFEKLRKKMLSIDAINMIHLGARAFEEIGGEVVQTVAFIMHKCKTKRYRAAFARLVGYNSQKEKQDAFLLKNDLYITPYENFLRIPGMLIAYWASDFLINHLSLTPKAKIYGDAKQGLITSDNNRFLRYWYEVNNYKFGVKWFPYIKGGGFRKWYGNHDYVVNWENEGFEIRTFRNTSGELLSRPQNIQYFFKESLTWNDISTNKFCCRYVSNKFAFDASGPSFFPHETRNLLYLIGLFNSNTTQHFLELICQGMHFSTGHIPQIPVIFSKNTKIEVLTQNCIGISKSDWDSFETSRDFKKHPLMRGATSIADAFNQWSVFTVNQFNQLKTDEEELNRIFIDIYNFQDELTPEVEDKNVTIRKSDLELDIRNFISYAVGCMFGRYSLDVDGLAYAGSTWDDSKYSTFIPDKDNILPITDEEYFSDDIVGRFVAFVRCVYDAETLEENLDFIAKALGNKGNSSREIIRNYFLKDFFKDHCKIYQNRPIYWQFDSGKAEGFKSLIYTHRYDENTIGNLRIDYLHRMQRVYESEISRMQGTITNSSNAREVTAAEKRKEKLTKQLKESKDYDEMIAHLALARISINLDDGVKVNYEKVQTGTDGKKYEVLALI